MFNKQLKHYRQLIAMYGALYGFIKYVILGKEADEATGNQTISSTQEAGNYSLICFYIIQNYIVHLFF